MFWPAAAFNLTQTAIQCEQQWGVTPRALWAPINLANKVGRAHRTAVEEEGDSTGTQTQTQTHTHTHTQKHRHTHTHTCTLSPTNHLQDLAGASNIVFSNGGMDPWSAGGVLRNVSESVAAVVIPHGAHHLDLMFSNAADPADVIAARELEVQHMHKWVQQQRQRQAHV